MSFKILGLPNDDIDVALDNMSGVEFASILNNHLMRIWQETHSIAVIQVTLNIQIFWFLIIGG